MEKVFSKMRKRAVLLRFLLNLDDKIYEFMPRYATKTKKYSITANRRKWRKIKENQHFQGVFKA